MNCLINCLNIPSSRWMTRRDTEETRLSEPVRAKSGLGELWNIGADSASDTASTTVLITKGESEIRFPPAPRHKKGKCFQQKGACQKKNTKPRFHDCSSYGSCAISLVYFNYNRKGKGLVVPTLTYPLQFCQAARPRYGRSVIAVVSVFLVQCPNPMEQVLYCTVRPHCINSIHILSSW
jgi:hypothetical protein